MKKRMKHLTPLASAVMLAAGVHGPAMAQDGFFDNWEVSGYARMHLSWNLENPYLMDGEDPNGLVGADLTGNLGSRALLVNL